jgi:hypothetical protein
MGSASGEPRTMNVPEMDTYRGTFSKPIPLRYFQKLAKITSIF